MITMPSFRSALAVLMSIPLLSLPSVAQQYPGVPPYPTSSQSGVPPYPGSQSGARPDWQTTARAAGTASMNFPPDRGDANALQCDQLADPFFDPLRVGNGVRGSQIQVSQALPVCQQAASRVPARPRYQYLYGRVLVTAQRYSEAAQQYALADRAGYAPASFGLGGLYEYGLGVTSSGEEAARLYYRAANAGIANAFAYGGMLYVKQSPPNYPQAVAWLEHAVQAGSAPGFADLGWLYQNGYGVPADPAKALSLYNEAAKRGNAEGMFRLGVMYHEGQGVPQNPATGCQWFLQAAKLNQAHAEHELGRCLYSGDGMQQNHGYAFGWFLMAAQAGLVISQAVVADLYLDGDGVTAGPSHAAAWYRRAAEQGNTYSMTQLGVLLRLGKGVAWNEAEAMQWFAKAAQRGEVQAKTALAMGYKDGLGGGRQDYAQAARLFGEAAQAGDGWAQINLGFLYEKGWGVPQDLNRAKQLYAQAAANRDTEIAKLGRQYFADVPASRVSASARTPDRSKVSSSSDSSSFWTAVVIGVLAIGALSALSGSGSKSETTSSGGWSPTYPQKSADDIYRESQRTACAWTLDTNCRDVFGNKW